MLQVHDRIYIGNEDSCRIGAAGWAVVHACKSPCHQRVVGYRGSLPSSHPHYLALRRDRDLFLNLVDPPIPLFKLASLTEFLSFAREQYDGGASLLIHCNQGESRAPSLALVFLAKHLQVIPADSFSSAYAAFIVMCPGYRPGRGIWQFLEENWMSL